ncbi:hypothetical protein 1013_scaffold1563_00001 [Bacteriophage sp.]|nr:hypothetical protein 1013_scaffold1563_00001 [Bacteriophage sp.]
MPFPFRYISAGLPCTCCPLRQTVFSVPGTRSLAPYGHSSYPRLVPGKPLVLTSWHQLPPVYGYIGE